MYNCTYFLFFSGKSLFTHLGAQFLVWKLPMKSAHAYGIYKIYSIKNFIFTDSPLLKNCKEKLAGTLVLYKSKDCCEILSAHTTKSMCVAYATENDKKVCIQFKLL